MLKAFVSGCSIALFATFGTAHAQDWTKSKWGPNDEIGAANYMTPELVVKAASLIKTGKTYALGIPVDSKTPAYPPRTFKITIVQPGQAGSPGLGPTKTTYNDDIIDGWVGIGSQLDGLLLPAHYRGGSVTHVHVVRALYFQRAQRTAGHRRGFRARAARGGHSIYLR